VDSYSYMPLLLVVLLSTRDGLLSFNGGGLFDLSEQRLAPTY
jgi:hypothetical protein